jgi:hypothetical protein
LIAPVALRRFGSSIQAGAVMSYDAWKLRSDIDDKQRFYHGPTPKQIAEKLEELDREIAWNIRRLGNLVLDDEDREHTEDLIEELRGERNSLAWCFNAA